MVTIAHFVLHNKKIAHKSQYQISLLKKLKVVLF